MKKITILLFLFFSSLLAFSQSDVYFYPDNTFGCAPLVVTFTNSSYIDANVEGPVTYYWSVDGEFVGNSDTTFVDTLDVGHHNVYLEVRDANNEFVDDHWEDFNVSGNPKDFWVSTGESVCPGEEINFDFDWFDENEYSAQWNFGDNSPWVSGNWVNHKYSDIGTYTVELIIESYCGMDTLFKDIVVGDNAIPDVKLYTRNGDYFCPGDVVQFETGGSYNSYRWIFDDGEESFNPSPLHAFSTEGQYNVKVIVENSCGNTGMDSMLINIGGGIEANAEFGFYPEYSCPNQIITFESFSSGKHTWDFGNGTTSQLPKPVIAYADTGNYTVTHILENGCGSQDTVFQQLRVDYTYETIYDYISFSVVDREDYGYNDTIRICPGEELSFRNNSSTNNLKFQWIFNDGDTIKQIDASRVFNDVGIYSVFLRAINNCMGEAYSDTKIIVVDDGIKPDVELSAAPVYLCPGETVYFWDEEFRPNNNYTYNIIFGDGAQANDIKQLENIDLHSLATHVYDQAGDYTYQFIAENICGNSDTLLGVLHVNDNNAFRPSYYVSNSTSFDFNMEPEDWSMMKNTSDHKFTIPIQWPYWTTGMSDYFYIYFWYGEVDLMSEEEDDDMGPPEGVVRVKASDIVVGETVVAYVPFNTMEPEVTIAAAWYCDTAFNIEMEPEVFTIPMDESFMPISSFDLLPGGNTEIVNTLIFPEFSGVCNSKMLEGEYISELGDGKRLFLEFWEDEYDGTMSYDLYVADEQYSSNSQYIGSGQFNYPNEDTVQFIDQFSECTGVGTYYFMISNDSLMFEGTDECVVRDTSLNQHTFVRMKYDEYFDMSGCPGDPVKFVVAGGTEYMWYFGDGATSPEQITYHAYQDTGFYDAFVIVKNGCGREDTVHTPVKIGLHNIPYAYFYTSNYNVDANQPVYFNIPSWGDEFDSNQYFWDFGDGLSSTVKEPAHIYQQGGEYEVKLEVTNGCGLSYNSNFVYVNDVMNVCEIKADFNFRINGDTVSFFEAASGTLPTRYKWEFSDGTVSLKKNPVKIFTDAGVYNVCLTVVDSITGCADNICHEFVIGNDECYADFSTIIDNENNAVLFEDQSSKATEWFWNFGDNQFSDLKNPLHYYAKPGFYEVTLRIYSDSVNCDNIITKRIFVGDTDSVDCFVNFSFDVQDLTVSFIADVSNNITGGYWKFGDGHIAHDKDVTHTYAKPGEYKVCATVYDTINDCQKTVCKTIFVGKVDCQAEYTFVINDDNSVEFYNESKGLNLEYYWDFGDGSYSGEVEPVHYFMPGEVYKVCLAINDTVLDCYSDYCMEIVIADSEENVICTPEMSYFIQDGVFGVEFDEVSGQPFTEYYWDFGDGSFSNLKSPNHIFAEEGIYEVCLQVYNDSTNCGDGICEKVIIQDASSTIVTVDADFGFFVNQLTDIVTFTDKSTGNVTSRYWTFGDGKVASDSAKIKHHYVIPKTYEACLIVVDEDNGLKSKVCKEVIVGSEECNLVAGFNYVVDPVDKLIKFTDDTRGTANKWFWNFDDGTTSQRANPFHMYDQPGYYLVKLAVRDTISGCNDVHFELVQVGAVECKALFDYEVDPDSLTVKFANASRGDIADYYWYFGDHTSSNEENPVKKYEKPGLYRVALAVNNSAGDCADYIVMPVQVGEVTCEADFEVFVDSLNNIAYFENKSIGNIEKFRWFFGDGYQSTVENPVHFYPAPGYYTTRLVTASGDCMSKAEETILIGAQGRDCEADFFASIDENSQSVKFVDQSLGENLAYLWSFGDGNTSTDQDPVYTYETGGYYNVCLTVINGEGISNTTCKFIQVSTEEYNSCFADFIYTADSTTKTVDFTDMSAGNPNRWIWNFGDGTSSREQHPSHTYDEAGFYRVKLVSGDTTSGCASLTFDLVNVAEASTGLVAGFGYQVDSLSLKGSGKPVDFVGVSSGNSSNFSWSFGDGNTDSTTLTPTNVYTESGTYEVCFTVSDPITGMSNTYCDDVEVQLATDIDELFDGNYSLIVYPNPFKEEMRIRYSINEPSNVDIEVYDELGRLIDVIVQEYKYEGEYEVVWRNHSISNGIYNLRLKTETGLVKNLRIIKN